MTPASGAAIAAAAGELGWPLPARHTLVTLAERTDLRGTAEAFGSSVWPEFMLHDATADHCWPYLGDDFAAYQLVVLDGKGNVAGVARSAPLTWDGTADDLPRGWDHQVMRSVEGLRDGAQPDTLGAIMIVVDPARRGRGLGSLMVALLLACARLHGLRALIACVRPTELEREPETPIAEYAVRTRADGLPADAWLRIHVRLGGRVARPEPESMLIEGTVGEWESWTRMRFPVSGRYAVPGACALVEIDRDTDRGVYRDPNVWVVHDLLLAGARPPRAAGGGSQLPGAASSPAPRPPAPSRGDS